MHFATPDHRRTRALRRRFVLASVVSLLAMAGLAPIAPAAAQGDVPGVADVRSTTQNDSAEERGNGSMYLTSSDFEFFTDAGQSQTIGVRFPAVSIPNGSTITDSWIEFTADGSSSGSAQWAIKAETTASPAAYGSAANDVSSRATTQGVSWSPPSWTSGNKYRTPSLNTIVQAVVDGPWQSGNAVAFTIDGSGALRRSFTYRDGVNNAPRLRIAYTTPPLQADVIINEVKTLGRADWVEFFNPTDTDIDLSGFFIRDSNFGREAELPAGSIVPRNGYFVVEQSTFGFGLGTNDFVALLAPDASTFVTVYSWQGHQTHSWGRCPDVVGEMSPTLSRTPGAINDCGDSPLVINEIFMQGDFSAHWVELHNRSDRPIGTYGHSVCGSFDCNFIEDREIIEPGGFWVMQDLDVSFPAPGRVRLYDAVPTRVLLDSYEWDELALTSYGRCPDGGGIRVTGSVTRGAANDCSDPGETQTVEVRVSSGSDDAEEVVSSGSVNLTSSDLELAVEGSTPQIIGMRFRNISVPPDARVQDAWIEFEVDEVASDFGTLDIRGQRAGNAGTFTTANSNISNRPETDASVPWSPEYWPNVNEKRRTPSLAPIVQEIVSLGGWSDGNSMVFTIDGTGSRIVESYNGEAAAAPVLRVEYTLGDVPVVDVGPWPGSSATTDLGRLNGNDWSGLGYEKTGGNSGNLWAVNNGSATLTRIQRSNGSWGSTQSWNIPGSLDTEAVTAAEPGDNFVYVGVERVNGVGAPDNMIVRYDTSNNSTHQWRITELNAVVDGANVGVEGLAWIPDADLTQLANYNPAAYPNHGSGVFAVATESEGLVRFYAVAQNSTQYWLVGQVETGLGKVMGLEYDADTERLWATCDNSCSADKRIAVMGLVGAAETFQILGRYDEPSGHTNYNNEGFAVLPVSDCSAGQRPAVWSDDDETGGIALREVRTSLGC